MPQIDLLLLHPPSVYDFRQKAIMYGPVSDLIPSSPVFEMYPLGFLTITNYLEARGYRVWTQAIPDAITPKNRLLVGIPAADSPSDAAESGAE